MHNAPAAFGERRMVRLGVSRCFDQAFRFRTGISMRPSKDGREQHRVDCRYYVTGSDWERRPMSATAKELLEEARSCRELAKRTREYYAKNALMELARDLSREAHQAERRKA